MTKNTTLTLCAASTTLIISTAAIADGRLLLAGAEVRNQGAYYAYLGTILPLPGNNRLGDGWVQRYWLDLVGYNYKKDEERIDANARGLEAAIGYQKSPQWGSWGVYLGLRYQNTSLSPFDPDSKVRGNQLLPKVQAEITVPFASSWQFSGIASYIPTATDLRTNVSAMDTRSIDGYWFRVRVLKTLANTHVVGPELIFQGDPNYNATKIGVVYGNIGIANKLAMNLRAGFHSQKDHNSPYAGVEFIYEY